MAKYKYLSIFILPLITAIAFTQSGWWTFVPIVFVFGFIPLLELFFEADNSNMLEAEKELAKADAFYDVLLYLMIPVQVLFLVAFLFVIQHTPFLSLEFFGRVSAMGIMCGVLGINVGHELGHRTSSFERFLGEIGLLTSLEMHFIPYHNYGHHYHVATPKDPATARKNEWLYTFWFRSQIGSYLQAWQIEKRRAERDQYAIYSFKNKMVVYNLAQLSLLLVIYFLFNTQVLIAFLAAATFGILLLETVNYIEHYGLLRKKTASGRYERVQEQHSWNSNHIIGRLLLFELSRHSDHHFKASKHYQLLDSLPDSPQMPTGYPGMMLLALLPPVWMRFMNKRLDSFQD